MSATGNTFSRGLETEVQFLKGIGPRQAEPLRKLGLRRVLDVLWHLPRRYEDRRNIPPIRSLRPGDYATLRGRIVEVQSRPLRHGKVMLRVAVEDDSGSIDLIWFNQPWHARKLSTYKGEMLVYGLVKEGSVKLEISSPDYELIEDEDDAEAFASIVPVYPLTEGAYQKVVRKAAKAAIDYFLEFVVDPLPDDILRQYDLAPLRWCLAQTHFPTSEENRLKARRRLVFEEFLYLQLVLALRRAEVAEETGISFPIAALEQGETFTPVAGDEPIDSLFVGPPGQVTHPKLWDEIHSILPFELTNAQRRVIGEVFRDMGAPHPMNRLLQGDVGSGKTAVAACAILAAVRSGYQAALMAPTEILAEQHVVSLRTLFEPLGIRVAPMLGKHKAADKARSKSHAQIGLAHVVVGTHAIVQHDVKFANLGLAVIDEQHRFGVLQRAALRTKSDRSPDVLVMTATPIPRTLTMTLYGDLDLSIIDELPAGRRPIKTHWKLPSERASIYRGVDQLIEQGRQAYVVCPMIMESEKMQTQAAVELFERLKTLEFPNRRVGLLHGQMKAPDKELVMAQFRAHELDILVSTTVIEVGVDVPNACIMIIEDANRFGLSQLHQLRGRVGRGEFQSFCILVGAGTTDDAQERLSIMTQTTDGFKIAEADLKLRGPGEIAGTRQSGQLDFKVADLIQDGKMLEEARQAAIKIIAEHPKLEGEQWDAVRDKLRDQRIEEALITVS